jgi:putative ABC transport system permease protein
MPLTETICSRVAELNVNGNIQYVYIFSAVALFVLLLACINFMNLSTARSASRAKEVGISKVVGSEKKSLIKQFLTESILTTSYIYCFAMVIAGLLVWFNNLSSEAIAYFRSFTNTGISFSYCIAAYCWFIIGIYPCVCFFI